MPKSIKALGLGFLPGKTGAECFVKQKKQAISSIPGPAHPLRPTSPIILQMEPQPQ